MDPHKRFQQARNSQPKRISVQEIADRLGTTHHAIRHMERGYSEALLKKAITTFAPEWNLPESWFYESTPAIIQEAKASYNPQSTDIPIYTGIVTAEQCSWVLSSAPTKRPVRSGFLSGPADQYLQVIVGGNAYAPRIRHGSIILLRRSSIVPESALVLAQPKGSQNATLGVFRLDKSETFHPFRTFTLEDTIIGQVEMIHSSTTAGPNYEFNEGNAILITKDRELYQSIN